MSDQNLEKTKMVKLNLVKCCANCYWSGIDETIETNFGDCVHSFDVVKCKKHHIFSSGFYVCDDYEKSNLFVCLEE